VVGEVRRVGLIMATCAGFLLGVAFVGVLGLEAWRMDRRGAVALLIFACAELLYAIAILYRRG
jgi:hypothetical protein